MYANKDMKSVSVISQREREANNLLQLGNLTAVFYLGIGGWSRSNFISKSVKKWYFLTSEILS